MSEGRHRLSPWSVYGWIFHRHLEEQIEYEKDFDHSIPFGIVTLFIAAPLSLLWLVLEIVYWGTHIRQVYGQKDITASSETRHLTAPPL